MLSEDMDQVMRDYYHWAGLQDPSDVGYPHSIPTERLRRSVLASAQLTDDEALFINYALTALKDLEPEQFRVIARVYGDRKTIRWMAAKGEGDRTTLGRNLSNGLQFVRGVLFGSSLAS